MPWSNSSKRLRFFNSGEQILQVESLTFAGSPCAWLTVTWDWAPTPENMAVGGLPSHLEDLLGIWNEVKGLSFQEAIQWGIQSEIPYTFESEESGNDEGEDTGEPGTGSNREVA